MRRSDREVTRFEDIVAIMRKCDVCRVALNDDGYPYIVPLNFGMTVDDGVITLYFHGALEGTKYELMRKDGRAAFEMDCGHRLVTDAGRGSCTMAYESVAGRGRMEILNDEEKEHALRILMEHYHQEEFPYNQAVVPKTNVFRLVVEQVTGKVRRCG